MKPNPETLNLKSEHQKQKTYTPSKNWNFQVLSRRTAGQQVDDGILFPRAQSPSTKG